MSPFASFRIHLITMQRGLNRASLILIFLCSFFIGLAAQSPQSLLPQQPGAPGSARQLHGPVGFEPQSQRGISHKMPVRPGTRKSRPTAKAKPAADLTPMPLFLEEPQYPTGANPWAAAVGDFDDDGKQDLAVANQGDNSVSVLLGNGDGTFRTHANYPTGNSPQSVAMGDFNGDGRPDLAVANAGDNTVSVLLGKGDGTVQPHMDFPTGSSLQSLAVGDFSRDGKPDLAVVKYDSCYDSTSELNYFCNPSLSVLLGNGDGTFQPHKDYPAGEGGLTEGFSPVAVGDFNGDGKLDLAMLKSMCYSSYSFCKPSVSVLLGIGDGSFQTHVDYPTASDVLSLAVGDFNGDSKLDFVVENALGFQETGLSILLGNGDGTFQAHVDHPTGDYHYPHSITAGDFNGDGQLDLATVGNSDNIVSVLLGNGDGTFQAHLDYPTGGSPQSVAVGDFNGDGNPDLAVSNEGSNSVSVLLGNSDGTFQTRRRYYPTEYAPSSVAAGDFNGDAKPDLVVVQHSWCDQSNYGPFPDDPCDYSMSVLQGNGDGTLQNLGEYAFFFPPNCYFAFCSVTSAAVGDLNGDGKPDVTVGASFGVAAFTSPVSVLLGNGDGTFQLTTGYPGSDYDRLWLALGDFNGDGKPDVAELVYFRYGGYVLRILLGNGDGTFQWYVDYPGALFYSSSPVVADFNGDGKTDLAGTNPYGDSVSVLLGNGNATFQSRVDYSTGTGPVSLAIGDFNGDGKADLAVANRDNNSVSVLLGNGDGTFQSRVDYSTGSGPASVAVGDFDGNGKADLVTTNSNGQSVGVLLGNGDGTFRTSMEYASGQARGAATVSDFNHDGAPDLAVLTPGSAVTILLNIRGTFAELRSSVNPSTVGQPVTLTANVRASLSDAGLSVPTGTVAFVDGTTELGRQALGTEGVATLDTTSLTRGTHKIAAVYSGDANFNPHAVLVTQIVSGPDFGMSAAPGSTTLKSGSSASFALTVTPMSGFSGAVSLTCSVSPTPDFAPTCTLNPTTITLAANGSATSNLTVATTGSNASLVGPAFRIAPRPLYAVLLPVFGCALLGVGFASERRRKTIILAVALTGLLVITSGLQSACGGSGNPASSGTPRGNYTVIVNAVSGSVTHTTSVVVSVQ